MTGRSPWWTVGIAVLIAGCATKPAVELTPQEQYEPELVVIPPMTPADDQRALQLFDNVAKNNPAPTPIKQLAAVLQAQVSERQKAIRDEQQKADKAIQKLEALRDMERSLMRDRVRSGGGGGGGGAGGGGSGH